MRAVLVTPLSGPLGRYGRAGADALAVLAERFAHPDRFRLEVIDSARDVVEAVQSAERRAPELLFGPYGSGATTEAVHATSRLVFNHGGASPHHRRNVVDILTPTSEYFTGTVRATTEADPRVRSVSVLHSRRPFGRGVALGAERAASERGLPVTRTVLPDRAEPGDLLLVAGGFNEETPVARDLSRRERRVVGLVAAGVAEFADALGERTEGLIGPAQWMPESAPVPNAGPPAEAFRAAYRTRTGTEPPYPAVQAFAAGIIALRCLRGARTTRDAALHEVAAGLECTTLFGRFRLDAEGVQVGHDMVTVQWQDGRRVIVWPPEHAHARLRSPLA